MCFLPSYVSWLVRHSRLGPQWLLTGRLSLHYGCFLRASLFICKSSVCRLNSPWVYQRPSSSPVFIVIWTDPPETCATTIISPGLHCHLSPISRVCSDTGENKKERLGPARLAVPAPASFCLAFCAPQSDESHWPSTSWANYILLMSLIT